VTLGAAAAACLLSPDLGGQAGRLDATRAAVQERIELERVISKEKLDWAVGRELLQARVELTQRQIDVLRAGIAESRTGVDELGAQKAELAAQNERLKDAARALADLVPELEARTRALLLRLPEPLRERVAPLAQRIPDDSAATAASLSERFMIVVGILNQVNKFNREILPTSEVRELPDGQSAEVTALYVGLGAAYYVTASGSAAGLGRPGAPGGTGWSWQPANEHAAAIAEAIAIFNNEHPAAFVRLPVSVGQPR
jgi:hypothetical protein